MGVDFTKVPPPVEGAKSTRRQLPVAAVRRLVALLARQAARKVIGSGDAPSSNSNSKDGRHKPVHLHRGVP
jgi:hypothetical protein